MLTTTTGLALVAWAATAACLIYAVAVEQAAFGRRSQLIRHLPWPRTAPQRPGTAGHRWLLPVARCLAGILLALPLYGAAALLAGEPLHVTGAVHAGLAGGLAPLGLAAWRRLRRHKAMDHGYRSLISHVALHVAAGATPRQALATAAPILPAALRLEVQTLLTEMHLSPLPAALERFAGRTGHPGVARFAHNIAYGQTVGISLAGALREEEAHGQALLRQELRRQVRAAALTMALVTVVLLVNGVLIWTTPVALNLLRFFTSQ